MMNLRIYHWVFNSLFLSLFVSFSQFVKLYWYCSPFSGLFHFLLGFFSIFTGGRFFRNDHLMVLTFFGQLLLGLFFCFLFTSHISSLSCFCFRFSTICRLFLSFFFLSFVSFVSFRFCFDVFLDVTISEIL